MKNKPMPLPQKPNFTYVNFNLSRRDKESFLASTFAKDAQKALDSLVARIDLGYKFSLSYDPKHSCYIASLTAINPSDHPENANHVLSARSAEWDEAIALLVYKDELLEHYWSEPGQNFNWG